MIVMEPAVRWPAIVLIFTSECISPPRRVEMPD